MASSQSPIYDSINSPFISTLQEQTPSRKWILYGLITCFAIILIGYAIYRIFFKEKPIARKNQENMNMNMSELELANGIELTDTKECRNGILNEIDNHCLCAGNWSGENCDECRLVCGAGGILDSDACICI